MALGDHLISHPLAPEQLMAYLDGEMPTWEMSTASDHVRQCRECQALAADFQGLSSQLNEWQVPSSSAALRDCPQSTKADEPQTFSAKFRNLWRQYRLRFSTGVLAFAVVIVLVSQFRSTRYVSSTPLASETELLSVMQTSDSSRRSERMSVPLSRSAGSFTASEIPPATPGPMIARVAELWITVAAFTPVRNAVVAIVASQHGYISRLDLNESPSAGHNLMATIQVPADHLDATMENLKHLGRLESESQAGEDVSKQIVDVGARLTNLRNEEGRLNDIVRDRTGKLSDVLAVEEQISRVRGEVEVAEAEEKTLAGRVAYASLRVRVTEEYRKPLTGSDTSTLTKLHNAAMEGLEQLVNLLLGTLTFLLANGPTLLLLGGLGFVAFRLFARYRREAR